MHTNDILLISQKNATYAMKIFNGTFKFNAKNFLNAENYDPFFSELLFCCRSFSPLLILSSKTKQGGGIRWGHLARQHMTRVYPSTIFLSSDVKTSMHVFTIKELSDFKKIILTEFICIGGEAGRWEETSPSLIKILRIEPTPH